MVAVGMLQKPTMCLGCTPQEEAEGSGGGEVR